MKTFFRQTYCNTHNITEDYTPLQARKAAGQRGPELKKALEKTRQALEVAYAGFDNAIDENLIDSYIYEINALQKRYEHLTELAASENQESDEYLNQHSPIRSLVSHVFG